MLLNLVSPWHVFFSDQKRAGQKTSWDQSSYLWIVNISLGGATSQLVSCQPFEWVCFSGFPIYLLDFLQTQMMEAVTWRRLDLMQSHFSVVVCRWQGCPGAKYRRPELCLCLFASLSGWMGGTECTTLLSLSSLRVNSDSLAHICILLHKEPPPHRSNTEVVTWLCRKVTCFMEITVYKDKALKGGCIAPKGNSIVICSQKASRFSLYSCYFQSCFSVFSVKNYWILPSMCSEACFFYCAFIPLFFFTKYFPTKKNSTMIDLCLIAWHYCTAEL